MTTPVRLELTLTQLGGLLALLDDLDGSYTTLEADELTTVELLRAAYLQARLDQPPPTPCLPLYGPSPTPPG